MNDTIEKTHELLNELIKINNDRIVGYETAIKETKDVDADLRKIFLSMIEESRSHAAELKIHQYSDKDDVTTETTNHGKIYRAWMEVKTALTGSSRESVLSVCERGEDAALNAYDEALETDDLEPSVREILEKQYDKLKSSHNLIRDWRDKEKNKK